MKEPVLDVVATNLANSVDVVIESMIEMRQQVVTLLDTPRIQKNTLEGLQPFIEEFIERYEGLVIGAGLAVAPGVVENAHTWMQSWHRTDDELKFTQHSLNPSSIDYYDYTNMPWYQETVESGESKLIGPYMDFGGADSRIMTASVPATLQDQIIGTVVADLSLDLIERKLLSDVGVEGVHLALLNDSGKVIASNSARALVDGYVTDGDRPSLQVPLKNAAPGWRLVLLPEYF